MGNRQRVELKMDAATLRWLRDFVRCNYWRVARDIEFDDLIQDGFLLFLKIRQRYRSQGRTHQHLVNTFKLTYRNHVHDLANERTRAPAEYQVLDLPYDYDDPDSISPIERLSPREPETAPFAARLASAPFRVREALAVYASEEGRERLCKPYTRRADGTRETLNERLCRLAGFNPKRVSLVEELRGFLATD